jgi:RNA polymerase sigma-70 factor (ECF subfamily)
MSRERYVRASFTTRERSVQVGRNSIEQDFESEAMPHLDGLYRAAVRMVGDATDAQDLVQEVYLQAWKSFSRYEAGTNCRAWLFAILFNKVQHFRRRKATQRVVPLGEDGEYKLDGLSTPPPTNAEITDEEILAALEKLSDNYRDVVILADVQEFSYKETADILGIPIGTVMSRLSRGRQMLRTALAACARDYGIDTPKDSPSKSDAPETP